MSYFKCVLLSYRPHVNKWLKASVSPHMYTRVKQEVITDGLRVHLNLNKANIYVIFGSNNDCVFI